LRRASKIRPEINGGFCVEGWFEVGVKSAILTALMGEMDLVRFMLDEIQAASLLLLIIAHGFLIRGCHGIRDGLPTQGSAISERIDGVTTVLDELADLIHNIGESVPGGGNTQPPTDLFGTLLTAFMAPKTPPMNHGSLTQEWQVHEDNPQTKVETEIEPQQHSS